LQQVIDFNANPNTARVPPPAGTNYEPSFPVGIVDEINMMKGFNGVSEEAAMAFILDKYNTGIALLKQDSSGNFKRLITIENIDANGNKTYTTSNCQ
jgi:hypothetical protein